MIFRRTRAVRGIIALHGFDSVVVVTVKSAGGVGALSVGE